MLEDFPDAQSERRIYDVLGRMTLRTFVGYAIFFCAALLPTISVWQRGDDPAAESTYRSGYVRYPVHTAPTRSWTAGDAFWLAGRTALAMLGTTLAMMVLMPYSGCKRYALLFGAPTGLVTVLAASWWLSDRVEIYRFEPVLVAVAAALPTGYLWFICCKNAYERPRSF